MKKALLKLMFLLAVLCLFNIDSYGQLKKTGTVEKVKLFHNGSVPLCKSILNDPSIEIYSVVLSNWSSLYDDIVLYLGTKDELIKNLSDLSLALKDGKKGENSMIFITEGQSASGVMTHSRDANTQAIFSLRGKPENMYGKKQAEIYKNDELYQLMMALGIENDVEDLKYSKIVIATDADNDGFHIRNLVLTFFLSFFEELITSGRIYILETPLFRVRNKKENIYCYTETRNKCNIIVTLRN